MKIDAVLFDLDGTITDTEKYYSAAWPEALAHFGLKATREMILELRSLSRPFAVRKFHEWFGAGCSYDEIRTYRKMLTDRMFEQMDIPLKPGAAEILEWLKEKKILSALVTAQARERAVKNLEKTGLAGYFGRIIGADAVELGKPAPDVYLYACRELGLRPERTLAVEDSPNGVRSAFGAGCRVIMVPDLSEPDEEIRGMLYACADRLTDIKELMGCCF